MQTAWNQLMSFKKVALYTDWSVLRQMLTFALENLPVQHRAGPWPRGLNLRKWTFILNLSFLTPAKHVCHLESMISF